LTIRNGNANGESFPDDSGGGVYNEHARVTLSDCAINSNSAFTFGGGVFNDHAPWRLTIVPWRVLADEISNWKEK